VKSYIVFASSVPDIYNLHVFFSSALYHSFYAWLFGSENVYLDWLIVILQYVLVAVEQYFPAKTSLLALLPFHFILQGSSKYSGSSTDYHFYWRRLRKVSYYYFILFYAKQAGNKNKGMIPQR
jgi:hypothetical protein